MSLAESDLGPANFAFDVNGLIDALPVAVYTTDANGVVTSCNRAAAELAGRSPEIGKDRWCVTWRLFRPDGTPLPLDQCPMAVALKEGRPVRDVPVVAERPDGARVPVMPFPTPLFSERGELLGAVNLLVDVSALQRAQAAAAQRADEQSVLFRFTDRLFRAETIDDVYAAALDAILSALKCSRASILLFDDADDMQFVASRGLSAEYRAAVSGHTPWTRGERDPAPIWIDDIAASDQPDEIKTIIGREGIGALAFIPLVANGGVIGKFMVYHDEPHAFSSDEIELALNIARQLGFAIERERAREFRRVAETDLRESEERFRAIVDTTPECVKLVARNGALLHMNASGLDMIGADCFDIVEGQCIYDVIAPEDRDRFKQLNERVCAGEKGSLEFDIVGLDGTRRHMETHATPFEMPSGETVQLAVTRDISERKRAEERQRKSDSEFRTLADNIHHLAWMTDATGWIYWYNRRWFDYTGTTIEEMQGWGWRAVHHPDHVERVTEKFKQHVQAGKAWEDTFPLRSKTGEYRWFLSRAQPIRDAGGNVVRWFGTNTDITERLRAEEQRTLLIHELNHRVKNTLATVQSLAMQTFRNTSNSDEARLQLDARLTTLSRAHDLLTAQNWEGAGLREVLSRAVQPFQGEGERIKLEGPDVRVTPKQALALSIALHELATNAAKYGALSNKSGEVDLSWEAAPVNGHDELRLAWREQGGPPVIAPERQGFGVRLIERSLAQELGGDAQIDYRPEGVVSTITTPLEYSGVGGVRHSS